MNKQIIIGGIIILIAAIAAYSFSGGIPSLSKEKEPAQLTCNFDGTCDKNENQEVCPEDCGWSDNICNEDMMCVPPENEENCNDCVDHGYQCPETNNIDCMPMTNAEPLKECEPEYNQWIEMNCLGVEFTH